MLQTTIRVTHFLNNCNTAQRCFNFLRTAPNGISILLEFKGLDGRPESEKGYLNGHLDANFLLLFILDLNGSANTGKQTIRNH